LISLYVQKQVCEYIHSDNNMVVPDGMIYTKREPELWSSLRVSEANKLCTEAMQKVQNVYPCLLKSPYTFQRKSKSGFLFQQYCGQNEQHCHTEDFQGVWIEEIVYRSCDQSPWSWWVLCSTLVEY